MLTEECELQEHPPSQQNEVRKVKMNEFSLKSKLIFYVLGLSLKDICHKYHMVDESLTLGYGCSWKVVFLVCVFLQFMMLLTEQQ